MQSSRIAAILAVTTFTTFTWGCASKATPIRPAAAATVIARPQFAWPGIYDLVGQGFPEGERRATLIVERRDTALVTNVEGPPGRLISSRFTGDSAQLVWSLPTDLMYVEVQGIGDQLTGQWTIGYQTGNLSGTRRR
jgi:hypothetical protein